MKIFLFTLSICFIWLTPPDYLTQLKNQPIESKQCQDSILQPWGIECSSDYDITFIKAEKTWLTNKIFIKGKVHFQNNFNQPIDNIHISIYNSENESCFSERITKTNLSGEFEVILKKTNNCYLQFNGIGFTGYSIKIP